MVADRVQGGYPRFSVPRVSVLVPPFRLRFCGFGYAKYYGFSVDPNFHPWCSIGAPKMQPRPCLLLKNFAKHEQ